jgi:cyclic dehypoxanthinyl futalosine synthase
VLTRNEDALNGLDYGANDFDLPTEDEVTESAGATISHDFEALLSHARHLGYLPRQRPPFPVPRSVVALT